MAAELKGAADLNRKLAAVGATGEANVIRGILRAAMRQAVAPAKARAAALNRSGRAHRTYKGRLVAPGFASRSLRIAVTRNRVNGRFRAVMGVRREAFYAVQFLEFGTAKIPKNPWLRPAFASAQSQVQGKMVADLRRRLQKIARTGRG